MSLSGIQTIGGKDPPYDPLKNKNRKYKNINKIQKITGGEIIHQWIPD